jgi:hypothetical protein
MVKLEELFGNKMTVAVYDRDLTVRGGLRKQSISRTGDKISIHRGGKANFNPDFDHECVLKGKYPKYKFWKRSFDLVVVPNQGERCINFKTQTISGPNPEDVKKAAATKLLENLGKEKADLNFLNYITILGIVLIALKVFGLIK